MAASATLSDSLQATGVAVPAAPPPLGSRGRRAGLQRRGLRAARCGFVGLCSLFSTWGTVQPPAWAPPGASCMPMLAGSWVCGRRQPHASAVTMGCRSRQVQWH